ncbi:hypothetical protein GQ55_5G333500 [Panicum hallii var. hallii]|uniref:Replication factor A C-terminal domain-containing protein n=1 Tax=Panicum hallii var. hallii TaxID=1504633 RepID=A0A2T7DLW6_9POAL|nr:hypothetical protein GQ55_5G333500 [Panicum hallii var. hallii]PUZ56577.1 hypothetical protein GQ55_5G333500 [Panicum hallii var. hallii]
MLKRSTSLVKSTLLLEYLLELWSNLIDVSEETLTGGSACKWYLNEDIAEIDEFFERLGDDFSKIEWVDDCEESDQRLQKIDRAVPKTVSELRGLDPWESEDTNFMCTVTIVRMSTGQPWWCSRCHKAATTCGSEYKCAGGCVNTTATPKYRLCLVGADSSAAAEFVLFGRVAQQVIGKPVVLLMRSDGIPREIAAIVSQKFTFVVSISQKSLMQRVVSFQVNVLILFWGDKLPYLTLEGTMTPKEGNNHLLLI